MKQSELVVSFLLLAFIAGIYAGATSDEVPPEKCADCHSDSPAFKEWQKSDHANGLKTLLKDPNAGSSCLKCHSADYKPVQDNPWMSTRDLPTVKTASNPVSCSACHKHDSGIENNLITSAARLCTTCHVHFCGG